MALIRTGSLVGQVSGSIGATVYSHNRYGSYARLRTVPTRSTTDAATAAKNTLTAESQAWGALSPALKLQWETWAQTNPITNRLGDQRVLQGNAAFVQLNARINRAGGTRITSPPIADAPAALLTLSATYDIGAGDTTMVYTATPVGATNRLWVKAAVVNSDGIQYVENLMKLTTVGALDTASPFDYSTDVELRFGTLIVGQSVFLRGAVFDEATGLLSGFRDVNGVVITT